MKLIWALLFFISLGMAWLFGNRARSMRDAKQKVSVPKHYLMGLNFLLNEETDKAVDVFIKMLEVDDDTVETHLAVGKLFRKRGEVDRAIRIHQNLIARPQLEKNYREQSLLELGHDYLSAGVLDRAERIFLDLTHSKFAANALRTLIDIYQQEKDWKNAIKMAKKYESIARKNMQVVIAHYYCELAEIANQKNDHAAALKYLEEALSADKNCARASLLSAKILISQEKFQAALIQLKQIKNQNADYLSEAIDPLAYCYEQLNQEDELITYLKELMEYHPGISIVLILTSCIRKWKGDKAAANFVGNYLRRFPSLRGLALFVSIYIANAEGQTREDLEILQNLISRLLNNKPDYRCRSCGFSGKSLHWQCPGCKNWSTMLSLHNLVGEVI